MIVFAHHCGSLSDCFSTIAVALAVIAAVAIVVAGIIAFPALLGGLGLGLGSGGVATIGGAIAVPAAAVVAGQTAAVAGVGAVTAADLALLTRRSDREKKNDVPSWVRGEHPRPGETPRQAADRVLGEKYPEGEFPRGQGSEYSQIKKWFEQMQRGRKRGR